MDSKFKPVPTDDKGDGPPPTRDEGELCGLGSFRPRWLQRFADPKAYLVLFCLIGVVEGAYFTYFVGILSTLEKRFAFESKVSGLILIADNLSAAVISMLAGYYGTSGHKPRMVALGMILVSASSFLSALPYFVYGPALHLLSRDLADGSAEKEYCEGEEDRSCEGSRGDGGSSMVPAVSILFLANLINGFGYAAYYTIGAPYLDDNVKKKNSPLYFSAMSALRVFGPVLGFLLSSFCLKYYEDPFHDPGIDPHNPRWVGAWWMGFLILGVVLLFLSLLLLLFPRQLPERFRSETRKEDKEGDQKKSLPKLKDFPQEARRLLRNPILVCHVISVTFQVNGFVGYFVFMPKFMEAQYQQSASDASLFSGVTGILSLLIGILLGGLVIMKYKPRPRYLTGYMVLVEILSVLGLFVSMFLGCDPVRMPGTILKEDETLNLYNECNGGCGCTRRVFEPVCGEDGLSTFFSPCFAGCPNLTSAAATALSTLTNATSSVQVFESCACAVGRNATFATSSVTGGFCGSTCGMFVVYIVLLCISKFISATARTGNTLIMFRCVEAKDKSFALGAFGSVLALFAFIPYPLIYGALTDSACLVWEQSCGKTGNCWLYDSDKFRYYLHGMSMLLISVGICFDGVVFLLSDRLTGFYGDEDHQAAGGGERVARWLKEEEEEDVIFSRFPKRSSLIEVDPQVL